MKKYEDKSHDKNEFFEHSPSDLLDVWAENLAVSRKKRDDARKMENKKLEIELTRKISHLVYRNVMSQRLTPSPDKWETVRVKEGWAMEVDGEILMKAKSLVLLRRSLSVFFNDKNTIW